MSPSEGRPAAEARQPPVPAGPSRGSRDPRGRGKGRERQGGTRDGGLGGGLQSSAEGFAWEISAPGAPPAGGCTPEL